MDMHEHCYQMDFGAAVPRYIDAFFANVNWEERLDKAQRMTAIFRGAPS
jgi:Fe-Mn family superoxide dismutase